MSSFYRDSAKLAQLPTAQRAQALKRILPRAKVAEVLRCTGHGNRRYLRLPAWFLVWFVVALGLSCDPRHAGSFLSQPANDGPGRLCPGGRR